MAKDDAQRFVREMRYYRQNTPGIMQESKDFQTMSIGTDNIPPELQRGFKRTRGRPAKNLDGTERKKPGRKPKTQETPDPASQNEE